MAILTLNCWSHSLRYHLFAENGETVSAGGTVERIGLGEGYITHRCRGKKPVMMEIAYVDLPDAVELVLSTLTNPRCGALADRREISAVAHRVAHGGERFPHSVQIDEAVIEELKALEHLAPLHSAANITGITSARGLLPGAVHVAVFDTAFHHTIPEHAYIYPLPLEWYQRHQVRRYGFHGPSHLYLSRRCAALLGKPAGECNLITIHMERGVSLCAIRGGRSIDTSMGMTPLEGAVMETRCGDIDPGILAHIMRELNFSVLQLEQVLNQKSGIRGLTGFSTGRSHFLDAALDGEPRACLALEIETYRMRKYIGAYLAAVGPIDGIVFSSGNSDMEWYARERVISGLDCFGIIADCGANRAASNHGETECTGAGSRVRIFVIPTNEELVNAEDAAAIRGGTYQGHQNQDYRFGHPGFQPANHIL